MQGYHYGILDGKLKMCTLHNYHDIMYPDIISARMGMLYHKCKAFMI